MADGTGQVTGRARVSIRTKLMLVLLLACAPMVALVGWFGLETATMLIRTQTVSGLRDIAQLQARPLEEAIRHAEADARFLSLTEDVRVLAAQATESHRPSAGQRRHVESNFAALGESSELYVDIRLLDPEGNTTAAAGFEPGHKYVAAETMSRAAALPHDLRGALQLPEGAVLASPLHLQRRQDRVITPHRPVIRLVAPVVDHGHTIGVVTVTARVGPLLPREASRGGATSLVDGEGWYLSHTDPALAWSGPRELNTGRNLASDLGAQTARALRPLAGVFELPGRLLATYPIPYGRPASDYYVLVCVEASEDLIFAPLRDYQRFFWGVLAISFVAPVLAGVALGTFFLRPMRQLRQAVHALAEGNLDARLSVHSADEFEVLATDFNAMAQRLKAYQQQERLTVVGRMAATIIHDLKNPLSALTMMARLLTERDLPAEQRQDFGRRVLAQSDRVLAMLQEILDFSRSGRTEITPAPMCFREFITALAADLAPQCLESGVTVSLEGVADCAIAGDRDKLYRALSNIVVNACEAMDGGGAVHITSECQDDGALIRIADSGAGIPEDLVSRIFEPFVTQGKAHGTGLGLTIAQAIIEAHGGRITADNGAEGGAVFTIWLPRTDLAPECCTCGLEEGVG